MITRKVAGRVYNFGYCIGNASPGGKGFEYPVGLSLGSGGNLYVLSRSLMNVPGWGITKCTVDHEFIWEDRGPNFGGRLSRWPRGVAVDRADNVYVSDDFANVIFLYDVDGNFQGNWGTEGSGDGQLRSPNGLAVDNEGNIFVVDSLNHRIQKFTRDGKFLAKWGRRGSGKGAFNMPWGIAVHDGGDVYVADWKNDRVQKFTAGGEYLATFGGPGTSEGELKLPSDVAVDDDGDVFVTDWGNDRLNAYAPDGTFLTGFYGDAGTLSVWAQDVVNANPDYRKARRRADLTPERWFWRPTAVAVDHEGRIIVADCLRNRIQVYLKERAFIDAQFNL